MRTFEDALEFTGALSSARTIVELEEVVENASAAMGFRYFALTHHVDFRIKGHKATRFHNYPDDWSAWFDAQGLGANDPVHRASQTRTAGVRWSEVSKLVAMTPLDAMVFEKARYRGFGDGFTVPGNVPGQMSGSVSFAMALGVDLDERHVQLAQLIGINALENVRRLTEIRTIPKRTAITERQLDCLKWSGRGKTDGETAQILDITRGTVLAHMRAIRARYDMYSRPGVIARALYEGTLCFSDIFDSR
jgi:LuxR family quorum-sensing system transcriptional regulator CciR